MEFRILGPLEVLADAGPVTLPRGRGRALLALLILRAGSVVSTERLIDELWGSAPPPTATTALHGLVSALRRRLEPSRRIGEPPALLRTLSPGYVLAADAGQVDANRFRHLVEAAGPAPPLWRAGLLRKALGLWRGPALAEFTYEPFAQTEIAALSELRLNAIEERIDADLACGRHAELVGELEALAAEHPLRERLREQLMLALYRAGRQAEALEVYGHTRRTLVEELGIEPGAALRRLEQAILRQDPNLDLAPAAQATLVDAADADTAATGDAQPWLGQSRKTVTVMFVDLTAAVAAEAADPEALRQVVNRGMDLTTQVLDRHGATIEGIIGDVVVALFGLPVAHEDDAVRAVRAAHELRRALATLNTELERERGSRVAARIGVNTGEVVVGDPGAQRTVASGDTVNVAAWLQQAAADGEVLVGETTRRLVDDAVVVEPVDTPPPGGRDRPVDAWQLIELAPDALVRAPHPDASLVGRTGELDWLRTTFARVMRRRRAELVAVVGEAGVGKSRLALEFTASLESQARTLTGRCPSYGEGITFWPLREIVRTATDGQDADGVSALAGGEDARTAVAQVAGAIGLGEDAGSAAQLFPAVRHFVETLAREQPLVVVVEDVHWAQPTFLDLLEYLAEQARGPALLLCLARPDLFEDRRSWAQQPERVALLHLQPLSAQDSSTLVTERLAGRALPAETTAQLVETAQGNPLFVEQLVAALRDEGDVTLPPSLQALLAARLDRLGPAERDLLRCASVVGIEFSVRTLSALVPDQAQPFVDRHLQRLQDKDLIHLPDRPTPAAQTYRFRHVLIQRAAYRSMTRADRAELHERVAGWMETDAGARLVEIEEVVGYHLERAWLHRRDLGAADERTRALAQHAGKRLASAGLRAYRRLDVAGAANLLARARTLLPSDHPQRRAVLYGLAEAYPMLGRHADALTALTTLLEEADREEGMPHEQAALSVERARVLLLTGPDPVSLEAIRREAEQALEVLEAQDDEGGVAKALFVLGLVRRREGAIAEMEALARRGLVAAQRAGHAREEAGARWNVAWAVQAGGTPVREAIGVCEELAPLGDTLHPGVLCELASLRAMLGDFDDAWELITQTRRLMSERWRHGGPLMYPAAAGGRAAVLAGDLTVAEQEFRAAVDLGAQMDVAEHVSQLAAALSQVLARLGQADEAERFAAVSRQRAPAESIACQALWRVAEARVRSHRAEHREAENLARAAAGMAPRDMLALRADLHVELAEVLAAAGQPLVALPVLQEATRLYERKGHVVGAARAAVLLERLTHDTPLPPA